MAKDRRKSFIAWINHEWKYNFKWKEHSAGGFKELVIPENRESKLGFADTKVRITISELGGGK